MKLEELALAIAPHIEVVAKLLKEVKDKEPSAIQKSLAELKVNPQTIKALVTLLESSEINNFIVHLEELAATNSVIENESVKTQSQLASAALVEPIMPSAKIKVVIHMDEKDKTHCENREIS